MQVNSPKIEGVVVVAEGAGNGKKDSEIIDAVDAVVALFSAEPHKIKVMQRKDFNEMKKTSHKNQIIITALAVMIVVAGYLNFTGQEISTSGITKSNKETASNNTSKTTEDNSSSDVQTADNSKEDGDITKDISAEDIGNDDYVVADTGEVVASEENPGEAVMVSNTIGADYFASAKLAREQTRAKNKETLMNIVNNKAIASADKKSAIRQVANITKNSEKENAAELMLQAKGFQNAVVSINDGNADVVVDANGLTEQQIAQIEDIVRRKTGIEADKIVITPVKVTDNNE